MALLSNDVFAKVAVGAIYVAFATDGFGCVEHDGNGEDVLLFGQCDEWFSGAFLNVGGVDDGEFVIGKAFGCDVVQGFKCFTGDGLVCFVVAYEAAEEIGGQDFCGFEVGFGKGGFA